ncbi:hypothetical protein Ancab_014759 [Ancistrocladus abbreviatus]
MSSSSPGQSFVKVSIPCIGKEKTEYVAIAKRGMEKEESVGKEKMATPLVGLNRCIGTREKMGPMDVEANIFDRVVGYDEVEALGLVNEGEIRAVRPIHETSKKRGAVIGPSLSLGKTVELEAFWAKKSFCYER